MATTFAEKVAMRQRLRAMADANRQTAEAEGRQMVQTLQQVPDMKAKIKAWIKEEMAEFEKNHENRMRLTIETLADGILNEVDVLIKTTVEERVTSYCKTAFSMDDEAFQMVAPHLPPAPPELKRA